MKGMKQRRKEKNIRKKFDIAVKATHHMAAHLFYI